MFLSQHFNIYGCFVSIRKRAQNCALGLFEGNEFVRRHLKGQELVVENCTAILVQRLILEGDHGGKIGYNTHPLQISAEKGCLVVQCFSDLFECHYGSSVGTSEWC